MEADDGFFIPESAAEFSDGIIDGSMSCVTCRDTGLLSFGAVLQDIGRRGADRGAGRYVPAKYRIGYGN